MALERHPAPDEKVKTSSYHEVGGGNAANTATAIALLSQASVFGGQFTVKLLAKIGDDNIGQQVISELERDGVDLSSPLFRVVPGSTTGFTTVLVSETEFSRTCLHTAGTCGELTMQEVEELDLNDIFQNVVHLHADGRHPDVALVLAKEAQRRGISVSVDVEKDRDSKPLDDFLEYATVVFTNAGQAEAYLNRLSREREVMWGKSRLKDPTIAACGDHVSDKDIDLLAHFMQPSIFFTRWDRPSEKEVVITRGDEGAVHVQCKSITTTTFDPEKDDSTTSNRMEIEVQEGPLNAVKVKHMFTDETTLCSAVYNVSTVGVLSKVKIVDTTGAGDTFIGAFILSRLSPATKNDLQTCLRFSSWVGGNKLSGPGARTAIPRASTVDSTLGKDYHSWKRSLLELVGSFGSPSNEEDREVQPASSWEDFSSEAFLMDE